MDLAQFFSINGCKFGANNVFYYTGESSLVPLLWSNTLYRPVMLSLFPDYDWGVVLTNFLLAPSQETGSLWQILVAKRRKLFDPGFTVGVHHREGLIYHTDECASTADSARTFAKAALSVLLELENNLHQKNSSVAGEDVHRQISHIQLPNITIVPVISDDEETASLALNGGKIYWSSLDFINLPAAWSDIVLRAGDFTRDGWDQRHAGQSALIDLFLLASCNQFIGSSYSTFGYIVSAWTGIPPIKCLNGEPGCSLIRTADPSQPANVPFLCAKHPFADPPSHALYFYPKTTEHCRPVDKQLYFGAGYYLV